MQTATIILFVHDRNKCWYICKKKPTKNIMPVFILAGSDPSVGEVLLKGITESKVFNYNYCVKDAISNEQSKSRKTGWDSFVCMLLDKGASPNEFTGYDSNLIEVTTQGNFQLVEAMLKHGAAVNFADNTNRTALHYACILSTYLFENNLKRKFAKSRMHFYLVWCKKRRCDVLPIAIHQFSNKVDVSNYRQPCNDKTHTV